MRTKKIGFRIILMAFIVIICFSWLLWIFLEKYVDATNYENRELAARPRLTVDNYKTFPAEYNSYFNDNIPFRNSLVTMNAAIDYFIFHKSTSDDVIVGDDSWLFYKRVDDGDPISCYNGTNLMTEDELQAIALNCIRQRDFLAKQGKEFVIFIAPNKERVYYEYMPEQYGEPSDTYQALQVINYLRENTDLRIVYPYEELMEAKKHTNYNIWYKTDTHWNWIGGYVGGAALMKELGIEMPSIDSEQIEISVGDKKSGDLAGMLNLKKQLKFADTEYLISGYDAHNMQTIEEDFNTVYSYTATNADPRKIYVVRDSFSSHMAPYIGSQFSETYLRHRATYSYDDFVNQNPDIFVYETVERLLFGLASFSIQ